MVMDVRNGWRFALPASSLGEVNDQEVGSSNSFAVVIAASHEQQRMVI